MPGVNWTQLVILHATAVKSVQDLGQLIEVITRIHAERLHGHNLPLVRPTPDVRVAIGSEGNVTERLELVSIQVIRRWQDANFCARLPQHSAELALGFRSPVITS